MNILTVDPGLATGIAMWVDTPKDSSFQSEIVESGAIYDKLNRLIPVFDVVAFETFTITAKTVKMTRQNDALELIGVVKFLCWMHDKPWAPQSPGDAKAFVSNAWLRKLGWYHPGAGHDNDAARHLFLFMSRRYSSMFDTLMRGYVLKP